jgi:hypothetical protein
MHVEVFIGELTLIREMASAIKASREIGIHIGAKSTQLDNSAA